MRVTTTFKGATDSRGARIVVRWEGHQRTVPYDYAVSDAHFQAVRDVLGPVELEFPRVPLARGFLYDVVTSV